jgi:hypothetical protein
MDLKMKYLGGEAEEEEYDEGQNDDEPYDFDGEDSSDS